MTDAASDTLKKALQLHREGKHQAAYELYQAILKVQPDHPDVLHLLGIMAFQSRNPEQGEKLIAQAIALRPGYREAEKNLFNLKGKRSDKEISYQEDAPTTWSPARAQLVDEWRHNRMLDFAACFNDRKDASWLTIGDAYGNDAIRLARFGITNVTPSNLTTTSLELNHKAGFIGRYLEIDAEKIDLADASYDFVLCKEAYHHMAQPMRAVYEMLRVARQAVFFIEPQDSIIDLEPDRKNPHWYETSGNSVLVGRRGEDKPLHTFPADWREPVGNYVYTISRREMRKLAIAMQLPLLGFKNFNDHYDPKLSEQPAVPPSPALQETIRHIEARDRLCQAKALPYNYLTAILFKTVPPTETLAKLNRLTYTLVQLPHSVGTIEWPAL